MSSSWLFQNLEDGPGDQLTAMTEKLRNQPPTSSIAEVLAGLRETSVWQERVYKDIHAHRERNLRNHVLVFDAAGLALFAVAGTQKALGYRLNPVMAALLGVLTGVGGGMLRDVLVAQVPTVLRAELYAVAALAGAAVVVVGHVLNFPPTAMAITGAAVCLGIRLVAIRRGWKLPVAGLPQGKYDQ